MSNPTVERRAFRVAELRADPESRSLAGYAAVFDSLSEDLGGFREIIKPGAFAKSIADGADVRALWNHDPNHVLGRTKSGTLRLAEDEHGLRIEIDPPPAQWADDLLQSVRRGDVDQMSFAFQVPAGGETWTKDDIGKIRELREVVLRDVSPVTYPAYAATAVVVRTADDVYRQHEESEQAQTRQLDCIASARDGLARLEQCLAVEAEMLSAGR
jgi:HK97 family phage prohead protease